jgi:hypothetical protein
MMKGQVVVTAPAHKRPHDENDTLLVAPVVQGGDNFRDWCNHPASSGHDFGNLQQDETSSHASSLKRARLFGEYRDVVVSSSFFMEEDSNDDNDDEEEQEDATARSNVAVRSASDDASTGRRWLLRSSPSSCFSIASTLTEISETVETLSCPGGAGGDYALPPDPPQEPCFLLEETPKNNAGDQVEALTGRMSSWSLTRMKTFRTSSLQSTADLLSLEDEVMSETRKHRIQQTKRAKREFMRALRRSDSTVTD